MIQVVYSTVLVKELNKNDVFDIKPNYLNTFQNVFVFILSGLN